MEEVNFELSEKRTSFRTLVEKQLDVFHYAGKSFLIKDLCQIRNSDGNIVLIFGKTEQFCFDDKCQFLFISGDVVNDTIISCRISSDLYLVFKIFYDSVKALL